ncbi:MAG: hypothetical protein MZV64_30010 [Ignavibacteriales bacterium]|nr:hypothetical protein [Ignavibacteriales bacterium]
MSTFTVAPDSWVHVATRPRPTARRWQPPRRRWCPGCRTHRVPPARDCRHRWRGRARSWRSARAPARAPA